MEQKVKGFGLWLMGLLSAWSSGRSGAATVDQTDIRGSGPHDWEPSGAASVLGRGLPVAGADLRDRALPALLAGGVLGWYEAHEGHELLSAAETAEVADLAHERERG